MHHILKNRLRPLAFLLTPLAAALPCSAQTRAGQAKTDRMYEPVPQPAARQITLGVLLFPGFEMLDAYGPMEMWGSLKGAVRNIIRSVYCPSFCRGVLLHHTPRVCSLYC